MIGEKVEQHRPIWDGVVKSDMLKMKRDRVRGRDRDLDVMVFPLHQNIEKGTKLGESLFGNNSTMGISDN